MLDPGKLAQTGTRVENETILRHLADPNAYTARAYYNYAVPSEALHEVTDRIDPYLKEGGTPSLSKALEIAESVNTKYMPSTRQGARDQQDIKAISIELSATGTTDLSAHGDIGKAIGNAQEAYN